MIGLSLFTQFLMLFLKKELLFSREVGRFCWIHKESHFFKKTFLPLWSHEWGKLTPKHHYCFCFQFHIHTCVTFEPTSSSLWLRPGCWLILLKVKALKADLAFCPRSYHPVLLSAYPGSCRVSRQRSTPPPLSPPFHHFIGPPLANSWDNLC